MKWLLGMTEVMYYRQRQGSGNIDGAIPHICQKQILIPVPSLYEQLKAEVYLAVMTCCNTLTRTRRRFIREQQ